MTWVETQTLTSLIVWLKNADCFLILLDDLCGLAGHFPDRHTFRLTYICRCGDYSGS
jgi:hypothetical protein